jgi:hypothetical protein
MVDYSNQNERLVLIKESYGIIMSLGLRNKNYQWGNFSKFLKNIYNNKVNTPGSTKKNSSLLFMIKNISPPIHKDLMNWASEENDD